MGKARIDIVAELQDNASKGIQGLGGDLEKLGKQAEKTSKQSSLLHDALSFAGGALITKGLESAGSAFDAVADSVINTNATLQDSSTAWGVLLGSTDAAQKKLDELSQFAAKTPFDFPGVDKASKLLETFGGAALNTTENLTLVGDVASGVNQPFEDVAMWAGRMYDAVQSGKPFGEAAARLQEMGAMSGVTRTKLEEMQKSGADGSVIWQEFTTSMSRFGGMMEKQSKNFSGLSATFQDSINLLAAQAGRPIFDAMSDGLAEVNDLLASPEAAEGAAAIADGLADVIEGGINFARSASGMAGAVQDNLVPALDAAAVATAAYGAASLAAATSSLPTLGAAITSVTTKVGALTAAAGPYAILAGAVFIAAQANKEWEAQIRATMQEQDKLNGTIQASISIQDKLNSLLDEGNLTGDRAKEAREYGDEIARLAQEHEALTIALEKGKGGVRSNDTYAELTQRLKENEDQTRRATEAANTFASAQSNLNVQFGPSPALIQSIAEKSKLAQEEMDKLSASMNKAAESGPGALGAVTDAENQFFAEREQMATEHWQKIADIDQQLRGKLTESQRTDLETQRAQLSENYAGQQQDQAVAYAMESAAARQHLGEMLIQYTQAYGAMHGVASERIAEMTAAISTEYGVQESESQRAFNAMTGHINTWAANTDVSAGSVVNDLTFAEETAQNTEAAMTGLAKDYTANLIQNFKEGKIDADALTEGLSQIPSIITSRVENNYAEAAGAAREVSLAVRSVPEVKMVRIEAMIDGALQRHSPSPIEQVMMAIDEFAKVKHRFDVGLTSPDSFKQWADTVEHMPAGMKAVEQQAEKTAARMIWLSQNLKAFADDGITTIWEQAAAVGDTAGWKRAQQEATVTTDIYKHWGTELAAGAKHHQQWMDSLNQSQPGMKAARQQTEQTTTAVNTFGTALDAGSKHHRAWVESLGQSIPGMKAVQKQAEETTARMIWLAENLEHFADDGITTIWEQAAMAAEAAAPAMEDAAQKAIVEPITGKAKIARAELERMYDMLRNGPPLPKLGEGEGTTNGDGGQFGKGKGNTLGANDPIFDSLIPDPEAFRKQITYAITDPVNTTLTAMTTDTTAMRAQLDATAWAPVVADSGAAFLAIQVAEHDNMVVAGRHLYEVVDLSQRAIKNLMNWIDSLNNKISSIKKIPGAPSPSGFGGFRAAGGPVMAGRGYIVGERGPEFITPTRPGFVTPNNKLGSGGTTVHVANGGIQIIVGAGASHETRAAVGDGVYDALRRLGES